MDIIFVEILPITHNEDTYSWIYNLTNQYSREVKDRGGTVRIVSETWNNDEGGYEEVILMITEENAYNHFIEREGKQRLSKVPMFATQSSTTVTGYQTLSIVINVYPKAPDDFQLQPHQLRQNIYNGAGGAVDRGNSGVKAGLSHLPTNFHVECDTECNRKSNKEMAERILKAKLYKHQSKNND